MDLHTVTEVRRPASPEEVGEWKEGFAYLAGGTFLFSEPQVNTHTLIDLETLNWPSLTQSAQGLEIGATCKIAELDQFSPPAEWIAAPLFRECCRAFLASFKIWNEATVGGNIVLGLPAGPMITMAAALEGVCAIWPKNGEARSTPVAEFVTGNHSNILQPGDLLRSIFLPVHALRKRYALRRFSLTHLGRSEVFLVGTRCLEHGEFILTVTAATVRPVQLRWDTLPSAEVVRQAIDAAIPDTLYLDDPNGSPPHRKHLTYYFAEQIRVELEAQ